jgi:hypothetical protein
MSAIEEDFELELRSLPGVVSVGFNRGDGGAVAGVTLLVRTQATTEVHTGATQIASYYPDASVTVEAAKSGTGREVPGSRVALVDVNFSEADGVSEVRLNYDGRIGIGREGSGPLIGGADATLSALRDLGFVVRFYVLTVAKVDTAVGPAVIVTLRSLSEDDDGIGIARAEGDLASSARATLDALNRHLTFGVDGRGTVPT